MSTSRKRASQMPASLNYSSMPALEVAREIASVIRSKSNPVIGLATGSSPIPVYYELIRMHKEEGLDFSSVTTINLDEYYGLPASHPQSYRSFMEENLFKHVNIKSENTHILNGSVSESEISAECERFEKLVSAHPPDIWLLGIGSNGHIAFNEPGSSRDSVTRRVFLSPSTIAANSRFFSSPDDVPKSALSVGISTILKAKKCILIATDESKRSAVHNAFKHVSSSCPASFLQESDCGFWVNFE